MTLVEIREIGVDLLPKYSSIPAYFKVESQLRIELVDGGFGGFRFVEERVEPYMKWDVQSDDDRPETWPERFGSDKMGVFMAFRLWAIMQTCILARMTKNTLNSS